MREKPVGEPLRQAIWANNIAEVNRLVAINGPDYFINGLPPLAHAMYSNNVEAAQALIDAGAYVKWRTATGNNLVYFAALSNKPRMAEYFISQGAGTSDDAVAGSQEAAKIELATKGVEKFAEREMGFNPLKAFKALEGFFNNYPSELNKAPGNEKTSGNEPVAVSAIIRGVPAGDTLNIRSGPGMSNRTVGVLEEGDEVVVTGDATMNNETDWFPIRVGNVTGWIRGKYLRRK